MNMEISEHNIMLYNIMLCSLVVTFLMLYNLTTPLWLKLTKRRKRWNEGYE